MRKPFPELIEQGRVRSGPYGTQPGETVGAFFVVCPRTKCELKIIVGDDRLFPWEHVSVSLEKRTPSWKELTWVKDQFFEDDECCVQYFPPKADYVNVHENVLHIWRATGLVQIPMPPKACV